MIHADTYPVLIAFGYKARRGKDTACAIIQEEFGDRLDIRKYAFADALRSEVVDAAFDLWARNHGRTPDSDDIMDAPSPLALMNGLCEWAGVPFDPRAEIEPGYPLTKQRALFQWWGTEYRRNQDPFYWVNKLRQRIEAERPKVALISDMRFLNERAYAKAFKGYPVKLVRPDLDEQESLTEDQSKHVSEVGLDSLPDSAFYRVIRHTSVDDLRTQVRQLMNDIIAELEPPDLTGLLNDPNALVRVALPGVENAYV